MKNTQLLSFWLKKVKINHPDQPVNSDTQKGLDKYWQQHVGICAPHSSPLLFNSGRLVVFCDSSIWAHQLRHQIPSLILQLSQNQFNVNEITIKLKSHPKPIHAQQTAQPTPVSSEVVQSIDSTSSYLTSSALKTSMKNLAQKLKNYSNLKEEE